ncbi:MAG TPA: two-component regulator propeller domain-containing protein, partial [Pyrinomonadaceae bacterium]|nr:two-component regulator propeller domain-containing protein [Pyrinomonadaceae bacterium]
MMDQKCPRRVVGCTALVAAWCLALVFLHCAPSVSAQKLSLRHYDVADGLAHSTVQAIHQDAKGYLWFATGEGLSRFDGYRFTNYGPRDGLGHLIVNAIAEDRRGRLWVGTNGGGVSRLIDDPGETLSLQQGAPQPATRPKFISFLIGNAPGSNRVNALLFDADNNLWCATDGGLYRAAPGLNGDVKFEVVVPHAEVGEHMPAFADRNGRLWFGVANDLIEVVQGRIIKYGPADEVGRYVITSATEDRQGRLFVANQHGVFEFIAPTNTGSSGLWKKLPVALNPDQLIWSLATDSTGALWIGTLNGLIKYQDGKQIVYTTAQGLSDNVIATFCEDRDDNLWIGTRGGGACKLSGELIVSFTKAEGLPDQGVAKVIEDRQGRIYASTGVGGLVEIGAEKATPIEGSQLPPFNNVGTRILQDGQGDWWIGTDQGLFRFQGPELQLRHGRKFTQADGISEAAILGPGVPWSLYEAPNGRLWICSTDKNLYWRDPARQGREVFQHISLPAVSPFNFVRMMIGDRSGALWLGEMGLLAKLTNGKIAMLQPTEGLPETDPRDFFLDSRGWLWIGLRFGGVSMTKDPGAAPLKFVNYSTQNGLASNTVWSITEDDAGRIYLGTGRGLDRLDPSTGRIHHFTIADGLAGDLIIYCLKDSRGNIWVATTTGLSKFNPRAERVVNSSPPIYLSRVNVAGEDLPLQETGALQMSGLALPASRNNLLVEFVGLDFQSEGALKYQYQLEGVDADWSPPTDQRSVNYARLAPGSYRFMVRAINREELVSLAPAVLEFRILPPLWQRWWFLTLATILVALAAAAIVRNRVARLIELERVRTRIAADLHDDIGSGLSRIAILSEVARHQVTVEAPVGEPLAVIASASRDLVDSMSDIVWAINPNKDQLSDLVQRMRRFASDLFTARQIEFSFDAPAEKQPLKLGVEVRRQVFLIFKEAVNNIARHSAGTEAQIELRIESRWLAMKVVDNGPGFDPAQISEGQGLASMRARAKTLGGELQIMSNYGKGTVV